MELLEKELEDMIFSAANDTPEGVQFLHQRGLPVHGKMFRQVNLGSYGIADLVSVSFFRPGHAITWDGKKPNDERAVHIEIYELKRGPIGYPALEQSARYKTGIRRLIAGCVPESLKIRFDIQNTLIGSGIDHSNGFVHILNLMPFVSIYGYEFDYKGLNFKRLSGNGIAFRITDEKPMEVNLSNSDVRDIFNLSKAIQHAILHDLPDNSQWIEPLNRIDYFPIKRD